MIARTYGKRNRKKSKLKPTVYGTVWETGDSGTGVEEDHHATYLKQFNVSGEIIRRMTISFLINHL